MGLELSDLIDNTATVTLEVQDEVATIVYRPSRITAARIQRVDEGAAADDSLPYITFFMDVLVEWDVMLNKRVVEFTVAELTVLPMFLLRLIFIALMRDVSSGESGKASSNTSQPKDHLAKSRSGTRSSRQRATSV